MFKFEMKGLDSFRRRLDDLGRRARNLNGAHEVPLVELFPPEFVRSHSTFDSFENLLEASGFKVESQQDLEAIPDDEWDVFIASHTTFLNWHEMLQAATAQWAKVRLGF